MAKRKSSEDLYDPRSGGQAIRLGDLRVNGKGFDPARTNYFTIYLIESGSGKFWADAASFDFGPDSLLFFVPYGLGTVIVLYGLLLCLHPWLPQAATVGAFWSS